MDGIRERLEVDLRVAVARLHPLGGTDLLEELGSVGTTSFAETVDRIRPTNGARSVWPYESCSSSE